MKSKTKLFWLAAVFAVTALTLIACATGGGQFSDTGTYGYFSWGMDSRGIAITGYNGPPGAVEIPAEINGNPVAFIATNAFRNSQLTSVTIPDSVRGIWNNAFRGNQLTSLTIPDSVTSIGDSAFANNQLTSVTFGDNIRNIASRAFANNPLANVTVPSGTSIDRLLGTASFPVATSISETPRPASAIAAGDRGHMVLHLGGGNGGYLTVSGIPAAHNGRYAAFVGESRTFGYMFFGEERRTRGAQGDIITLRRISGGEVTLPMWEIIDWSGRMERTFMGNFTVEGVLFIMENRVINPAHGIPDPLSGREWRSIRFDANGNASVSWAAGSPAR